MKRKEAFTLIEMLIVITVIGILAGMSFKLVQVVNRNAQRAATVAKLEKVAHALNEFKAEYGIYPPVPDHACKEHKDWDCRVCYQYENTNNQSSFAYAKLTSDPSLVKDLFQMGLVAYLWNRDMGSIAHTAHPKWVPDTSRDLRAKERWSEFLDGVLNDGGLGTNFIDNTGGGGGTTDFENDIKTIKDCFVPGNIIRYECNPPYMAYRLWSVGPDGQSGNKDDIHRDRWED